MKILVVIDAQEDFFRGALANENAVKIIPNLVERCKKAVEDKEEIYFTQDTHYDNNYHNTLEGQKLPVKHCIKFTEGWEIIPELQKYVREQPIRKRTFSSFSLIYSIENKTAFLPEDEIEIEICGVVSSICVLANAVLLRADFPNAKITINSNLIADINDENQAAAIACFKAQQIDVIE